MPKPSLLCFEWKGGDITLVIETLWGMLLFLPHLFTLPLSMDEGTCGFRVSWRFETEQQLGLDKGMTLDHVASPSP